MSLWNVRTTVLALTAPLVLSACAMRKGVGAGDGSGDSGLASDGQAQDTNDGAGSSGSVDPGTFKLYDKPFHEADPTCDGHTKLTLAMSDRGPTATMEQKLEGTCELPMPPPNLRTYALKEDEPACGSRIYTGTRTVDGKTARVSLTDNRKRMCRDLTQGKIIVEETDLSGAKRTLYSSEMTAPQAVSYTGVLTRIAGIGGESTGFGLSLDDGSLVELDLRTAGLHTEFREDARVSVTGVMKEITGVESTRQVLQVAKLMTETP